MNRQVETLSRENENDEWVYSQRWLLTNVFSYSSVEEVILDPQYNMSEGIYISQLQVQLGQGRKSLNKLGSKIIEAIPKLTNAYLSIDQNRCQYAESA